MKVTVIASNRTKSIGAKEVNKKSFIFKGAETAVSALAT